MVMAGVNKGKGGGERRTVQTEEMRKTYRHLTNTFLNDTEDATSKLRGSELFSSWSSMSSQLGAHANMCTVYCILTVVKI